MYLSVLRKNYSTVLRIVDIFLRIVIKFKC